jgi:uncharacterized protein YndB with AHSA1/START domain
MKSYDATATIKASPEAIWAILTDAPGYQAWDSGIERVEGSIAPGNRLKVVSKANPGRAFTVRVTEFSPGQRMAWSGGPLPMIWRSMPDLGPSFRQFANGLKERAER